MKKTRLKKPLAIALGGAALGLTGMTAQASPFAAADLDAGYMLAMAGDDKAAEAKSGEGKAGDKAGHKSGEAKCGEGKCGEGKADDKAGEAKCGGQ